MVLPVFAIYAPQYAGYSAALAGLAIGVYGLTQALFQIPFGWASDRLGRKPVIAAGLVLFALGALTAALSDSMAGLILGRALQGCGAVAAVVMALAADLTRDSQRTKAMAGIGASIGLAFGVAMVLGPVVAASAGLKGIFWLTAVFAGIALVLLALAVPTPPRQRGLADVRPAWAQVGELLRHAELLRLDIGIFVLHLIVTATFVVMPLELARHFDSHGAGLAGIYFGVVAASFVLMVPCIIYAERFGKMKVIFVSAIGVLVLACGLLAPSVVGGISALVFMVVFFTAFNVLEASLPSIVSKTAPAAMRGTALGIYSTAQFLGAFSGGVLAGWTHGEFGSAAVYYIAAAFGLIWLIAAISMRSPAKVTRRLLEVGELSRQNAIVMSGRLAAIPGVREAVVVAHDGIAYLKVDSQALDEDALNRAALVTEG